MNTKSKKGFCEIKALSFLVILIASFVFFSVADYAAGEWQPAASAVVIERTHKDASTQVGTGVATGANGNVAMVVTSSYKPEKWSVVIRVGGKVVSADAAPSIWAECESGKVVNAQWMRGRWSGKNHGWRISPE